jgi:hypothetical protein
MTHRSRSATIRRNLRSLGVYGAQGGREISAKVAGSIVEAMLKSVSSNELILASDWLDLRVPELELLAVGVPTLCPFFTGALHSAQLGPPHLMKLVHMQLNISERLCMRTECSVKSSLMLTSPRVLVSTVGQTLW